MTADPMRRFARHTIATLAYRGAKILRGAPPDFAEARAALRASAPEAPAVTAAPAPALVRSSEPDTPAAVAAAADPAAKSRSAVEILAHTADLLDWTAGILHGEPWREAWRTSKPESWDHEVSRFYRGLETVDGALTRETVPSLSLEQIFQGPIADAFTHLGQIALLRRLANAPVKGEPMVISKIELGRLGPDQEPPIREFD